MRFLKAVIIASTLFASYTFGAYTSPLSGVSNTGNYTVSWDNQITDAPNILSLYYGTPLFKLTEQRLNSGIAPTPISLPQWTSNSVAFSGKTAGQYVYDLSVRQCTSSGCMYFSPPDSKFLVTVGTDAKPIVEPIEPATSVGTTPYEADVNEKGEAVISIPINLPSGINGMHPQLSLNYNSGGVTRNTLYQQTTGWLSYGWSMSGISQIHRCTMGKPDVLGYISPRYPEWGTQPMRPKLKYDDTDHLCVDNERLILVSGTHFKVGAQYRTYKESFRLITIKGSDALPWFEARNPNGSVTIFGKNTNSRVQKKITKTGTDKTPFFIWSIDTETDTFGNQIYYWYGFKDEEFSYQANKQRIFPDFIQYPGGSVKFSYFIPNAYTSSPIGDPEDDGANAGPDRYRFNHDGGPQLNKISIRNGSANDNRTYWIRGTGQTDQEIKQHGLKVGSIQECAKIEESSSMTCLSPLTFNWSSRATSYPTVAHGSNFFYEAEHLKSIVDGLGATTQFDVGIVRSSAVLTEFKFSEQPFPPVVPLSGCGRPLCDSVLLPNRENVVVHALKRANGLAPNNFHTTTYRYVVGGENKDHGLGFVGFGAQRIKDETTGLVTYKQFELSKSWSGYPSLHGEIVATYRYTGIYGEPNSKLLSKNEIRYNLKVLTHPNGAKTLLPITDQVTEINYENGVMLGATIKTNVHTITSQNLLTSVTSTTSTGNKIHPTNYVPTYWGLTAPYELDPLSIKHTQQTIKTLGNSTSITDWRIGYTTKEEIRRYNGSLSGNYTDSKIQTTDYTIKPGTSLIQTAIRFNNDAEYHLQTDYGYNKYGQQTSITLSGRNIDTRTTTLEYTYPNTIPSRSINPYGHTQTNSDFDSRFGLPKTNIDENGLRSTQEFDAYGRLQLTTDVNGVTTTHAYLSCTSNYCETVSGKLQAIAPVYYKEIVSPISPTSREYYDSLGRVIRTETQGFSGEWIKTDTQYDELGRIYKISLPYTSGATIYYETRIYDKLGRLIHITQPDGGITTTTYSTVTSPSNENWLKITSTENVKKSTGTNLKNITKSNFINSYGKLVQTIDAENTAQATTTSYEYDALGNQVKVTVNGGTDGNTLSSVIYDKAGNRISLTDPNAGTTTSKYTALGELKSVTDSSGSTSTYTYDKLGRMLTRTTSEGTQNWVYDPVGAKGMPSYVTNNSGYRKTFFYQDTARYARLSRIETSITTPDLGTKTFNEQFTYDYYGRAKKTTYPSGFAATQNYNTYGYFDNLGAGDNWYNLMRIIKQGPFGAEEETLAGATTKRSFDPKSGRLLTLQGTYNTTVQNLSYQWLTNGSLESRTNHLQNARDTFVYDSHDRLDTTVTALVSTGIAQRTLKQQYSNLGNLKSNTSTIISDTQVTNYQYATTTNAGPHAVSGATINGSATQIYYNKNGAITSYDAPGSPNDKYISYNPDNQPIKITLGASSADAISYQARDEFKYAPDGSRYYKKSTYMQNGLLRTEHTYYVGDYEATFHDSHSTIQQSEKTQIGRFQFIRNKPYSGATIEIQQVAHVDHQGSVNAITKSGTPSLVAQMAFEPFGSRRNPNFMSNITSPQLNELMAKLDQLPLNGYTGHEMLDRTGFIHMNGRVYDPQLGRFLSPDPIVQAPTNSQSWNRYSYVFNNPLKYTDPTGYAGEVENLTVTGTQCGEKCQREGWANVFHSMFFAVNTSSAIWENYGDKAYNIASIHGQLMLSMAQGLAIAGATIKAGNGSKTDTNNVHAVLLTTKNIQEERTWGSYLPGTDAGNNAQAMWAMRVAEAGGGWNAPFSFTALVFASMWTDETAGDVAFTLGTAGVGTIGSVSVRANTYVANLILKNPSIVRWLPQAGVKGTLQEAGWVSGKMRQTTAARGGWSMVPYGKDAPRIQWSAAGGRHGGAYWKVSSPTLGTQRIPYFFSQNIF